MISVAKCLAVALSCLLAVLPAFANDVHRMVNSGKKPFTLVDFSWNDCGDKSMPGHLAQLALTPDPLNLPGKISIAFDANLNTTLASPLSLDLYVQKKILFWITIPCVDNFGSCNYEDICPLLEKIECPPIFQQHGIPCKCPITGGHFNLPLTQFYVDDSKVPSILANGEYKVTARLQEKGKTISCTYLNFSISR